MLTKRIFAIVITAAASALVLFGGWFVYERSVVAAPLAKAIHDIEGVAEAGAPEVATDSVTIDVTLTPDANLRSVYDTIKRQSRQTIGSRELHLNIKDESNERLNGIWSSSLFDVAQAMETKQYSEIPDALADVTKSTGVQAATEMDETNVYITLKDGDAVKYVILPRTPAQLEVW